MGSRAGLRRCATIGGWGDRGGVEDVAVAEPTVTARVIAVWPSFALIAAYELQTPQVRRSVAASGKAQLGKPRSRISRLKGGDGKRKVRSIVFSGSSQHSEIPGG